MAGIEACTAREWIRIGKALTVLPVTAAAFAERRLTYSAVRTLTRTAAPENEVELVELVAGVPAAEVGKVIATWMHRNLPPDDIAARQRAARSVKWRTEPDGMVVFTLRLQPHIAAILISLLSVLVMRSKARREADGTYPSTDATIHQRRNGPSRVLSASQRTSHPAISRSPSSAVVDSTSGSPSCSSISMGITGMTQMVALR